VTTTTSTTTTPTPWPTGDQVIAALGMQDCGDLHPNWHSVLGRLRQDAERHTALRAARELLERERLALAGERPDADPVDARPSGSLAIFDAIAKVGELETMALCAYVRCGQAALELSAAGAAPASWSEPLPGERPRVDGDGEPLLPEPGEARGDLRVPEPLAGAPGVDLLHVVLRQFNAITAAEDEWEELFGCNDYCADYEDGCGGGPHIPEHMIDEAREIEREMDRAPEYLADYADAAAWTLTHGLRDRLRPTVGAQGPRGGES